MRTSRRHFLRGAASALAAGAVAPVVVGQARARVVVIGGGFAGASCARALAAGGVETTLVEAQSTFTACPLSNAVIGGTRDIAAQRFGYTGLAAHGVGVVRGEARTVDPDARTVTLADGTRLAYERLVIAPGIDMRWDALPGYDQAAAERMPHAWKAGAQTTLLRRQLEAMDDGGLVVVAAPANPYRCPPGPYERASLIAHYLSRHKPRSKVLILDAKDRFSKQALFESAWSSLYPGLVEWVPLSAGGAVIEVDPERLTVATDFETHRAAVANVIPPQKAGSIAAAAGVADRTGWCPVDPGAFESTLVPGIHVVGDAAIAGAMPKSAFAANAQAKVCAAAIVALLAGDSPRPEKLVNTCYSLVAPDHGISVAAVYRAEGGRLVEVEGAGGVSPANASEAVRRREAELAEGWFRTITREAFG
ncbi:MAG: FAD-dependent oxidoreductase [Ectothiorhodospiraceae bacterium]|nr:FAD-dependent oxidoreductase [Ectothiorhodospiraceae bacterium]